MLILVAIVTLRRGDRGMAHDQRHVVDVVPLVECTLPEGASALAELEGLADVLLDRLLQLLDHVVSDELPRAPYRREECRGHSVAALELERPRLQVPLQNRHPVRVDRDPAGVAVRILALDVDGQNLGVVPGDVDVLDIHHAQLLGAESGADRQGDETVGLRELPVEHGDLHRTGKDPLHNRFLHRWCALLVLLGIMGRVLRLERGDRVVVEIGQHLLQQTEVFEDRGIHDPVRLPVADEGVDVLRRDLLRIVGGDPTFLLQLVEDLPDLDESPAVGAVRAGRDVPVLHGHVFVQTVGERIAAHLPTPASSNSLPSRRTT